MKRSTCLSAFLVALSVTSLASAAPDQKSEPTPRLVAQAATNIGSDVAQSGDSQPGAGTGAAAPGTAPADGAAGTTQPAVSIGTTPTAPATDTPAEAPAEPEKKPKPRPFAGTQIYNQNSMSTATMFRGQQQDWNPTVESNLWLLPRYAINKDFQLRGRMIITYEYTNSDSTTYRNEPMLSDAGLQLFYRSIPAIAGIKPMLAATVTAPTSKASRARTMYIAPGVIGQLSKGVEHVLGGELMFLLSVSYTHPLYSQRVPGVVDERDVQTFTCVTGGACGDLLSGQMNASDTMAYMFLVAGEWGKWSPAFLYFGGSQWAYTPKTVSEADVVPGGNNVPVTSGQPQGRTATRQTHYFNAFVDYHVNPWLTAEVGYWLSRSALNEAGKYGNPFFDRFNDMRAYIGFNVNIDNLMKTLEGGDADAGIVRAKNRKQPFFTF